jgi:ABC-type branched-subunit amino acid transport system substrate-binding protein
VNQDNFAYILGGDLEFNDPSYVEREADGQLESAIKNGEFCYVFNCSQMGKTSLANRIFTRLKIDNYACCFISLSDIGSDSLTVDSWYFTLSSAIASELHIVRDIDVWWRERQGLSSISRFNQFIEKILLTEINCDIVILIDEIDVIRRLEFSTDDFFAVIRSCYSHRANRPEYKRLKFVFLGVASPSSLIQDPNSTPFNIGTPIVLQGFSMDQAKLLAKGFEDRSDLSEEIIKEIIDWTGGQPFLTQKLCKLIAESTNIDFNEGSETLVKRIARSRIIDNWVSYDEPRHLRTIKNRLFRQKELRIRLLRLYKEILDTEDIEDPEVKIKYDNSPEHTELRLSGLVIERDGKLQVFNRIYKEIFNSDWVDRELSELQIPYLDKMNAWDKSSPKDKSQLLNKEDYAKALNWAEGKNLSPSDREYLIASETSINNKKTQKLIGFITLLLLGLLVFWITDSRVRYQFESCYKEKGIVGERLDDDTCFRPVITSGQKIALLSSSNFYLNEGVKKFKSEDYSEARTMFEKAISSDSIDPIAQIFFNNSEARIKGNPLKIAVVAPIDYNEAAAIDILRGAADAQTEFNKNRQGKLLEIVIANDANKPRVAEKVAQDLANENPLILAVVGHQFSGSTKAALEKYKDSKVRIMAVAPTSSASSIEDKYFRRMIISTQDLANIYIDYFSKHKLNNIAVINFTDNSDKKKSNILDNKKSNILDNNLYLEDFYNDIDKAIKDKTIKNRNVKIINSDTRNPPSVESIRKKYQSLQAILIISSGVENSKAIALIRENYQLNNQVSKDRRIPIFVTHAIADREILDRSELDPAKNSFVDVKLVFPCKDSNLTYISAAKKRWNQTGIYWRTGYSYDATKTIIKAIERSSDNPTRAEISKHIGEVKLTSQESSGFPLDNKRPICVSKIENSKFVETPESPKKP